MQNTSYSGDLKRQLPKYDLLQMECPYIAI